MEIETLKKIIEFLEKEENRQKPFAYKVKINHPFTEDELNFDGDLILNHSAITSLPEGLRVQGDLSLFASAIKTLPEGLYVKGSLDVSHTYIESLPDNLYVGGDLYFRHSDIEEIPKNLYVGGNLYIGESFLAKKYTDDEIRRNKNLNNGSFKGNIIR
jgi:hypothetical protein